MRRELRGEGLVGRARRAMARSLEGTRTDAGFQILVSRSWFSERGFQSVVSQSKNGFPKYGFSIIIWYPKIWFLNQKMVSQNMVSQSKFGKLYVSKSDKCI